MSGFNMDDYVPVAERVEAFYAKHPDGSLQSEIIELTPERVTVKALAYRSVDDSRPGVGHSSLNIPGSTTFTRGSEIENAETSAWGRAIAALGFEVKRGLSSREEVRNKQPAEGERSPGAGRRAGSRSATTPRPAPSPVDALRDEIAEAAVRHGLGSSALSLIADAVGVPKGQHATEEQLRAILERIETPASGVPADVAGTGEAEVARAAASPTKDAASEEHPVPAGSDAATSAGGSSLPPGATAPAAPTMEDVLAVTGGEEVPPAPGTPEYKALPNGTERARAKAYHDALKKGEGQQESLAEALGAPTSD